MVGSASWQSVESNFLSLDGVLKLESVMENSNVFTSCYSLVTQELVGECYGDADVPENQSIDLNPTLIGEGSRHVNINMLCIVACGILNLANHWAKEVGDCTTRLSLRYPSIWSIRNNSNLVGQVWTNKTVNVSGYFRKIMFRSWENGAALLPGLNSSTLNLIKNVVLSEKGYENGGILMI
ncbi:Hypothetical predicted protein [Olea europaea subsp. europaea]|uniref:DUF2921 domain-containing protein n=1 Tax=Olea europaea subsp. europaea TaxID=158383 RepID=A0A8S0QR88_OLEEU|nr:Hypothetical predicted protein [Olea europaea subsp. europaea]